MTNLQHKYFNNHEEALEAFIGRKVAGMNLSERVWNMKEGYQTFIEDGLKIGVADGKSAIEMTKDVKSYLTNPDKLFRRVRGDDGELHLSKNARAYHPGAGVYRSSYMNALRLTATETNMAYRTADYLRLQDNDFVVGIHIGLSNNHTCKGFKGIFVDICDELAGDYPKDFKFVGWHPFCRCHITSIQKTDDEIAKGLADMLHGETPVPGSVNEVNELPQNFKNWLGNNAERIENAKQLPYFIRDNEILLKNSQSEDARIIELVGNKDANKTDSRVAKYNTSDITIPQPLLGKTFNNGDDVANIINKLDEGKIGVEKWMKNGKIKLANKEIHSNGETNGKGEIYLSEKRYKRVISAFQKIADGHAWEITRGEADSMATLWHEITHNRHVGFDSAGEKSSKTRMFMEMANEWVSRKTLPQFYERLGVPREYMPFLEFTHNRPTCGYNKMANAYDCIIGELKLNRDAVLVEVRRALFSTGGYNNLQNGLARGLKKGGISYKDGKEIEFSEIKSILKLAIDENIDAIKSIIKERFL